MVFAGVVRSASFFRCDDQAPPFLSNRAVWQEDYKRGGRQGHRFHGSFHHLAGRSPTGDGLAQPFEVRHVFAVNILNRPAFSADAVS